MRRPKPPRRRHGETQARTTASPRSGDELRRQAEQHLAQGRVIPALEALNSVIEIGEAGIADWLMAGNTLLSVREFSQAIVAFEQGLTLDAEHEECRFNLAAALFQMGDVTAAANHFEFVAERYHNLKARLSLATIIPGCPVSSHERVLAVRRQFAASLAVSPGSDPWHASQRTACPRLRVGYLSAFFHRSNYMKPVWGLINGHDRGRFEICLFADDTTESGLEWFQRGPHDRVHLTRALDNGQLISLIREQQLDIVVDLNGYSVPSRLPVLVSRLAPVGVAWFNMYATSALPGIDWIVGDEFVIRRDEDQHYSESVFRLPQSYLSFVVGHEAPDVAALPCLNGSPFTFGSLVSQYKISPTVLDAWSEILKRAPESQLLLANRAFGTTCNRDYVVEQFLSRDVGSERLRLLPPAPHFEFLKYYNQIDIALDSFPYNGGTTTTEAIWQGVPVLTFDGDRWAARTSRTLLMNCHLGEFVAASAKQHIEAAVRWATEPDARQRLAELRQTMRPCLISSPVCQISSMVQAMENFFMNIANKGEYGEARQL